MRAEYPIGCEFVDHNARLHHCALVYGSADVGEGYAVYALESVQEGIAGADADAELKNLANRLLSERRGRDYFANYRSGLRQETKPKIYPDRL